MIIVKPIIEKPYTLDDKGIKDYLKELKETKKEIEKYDWTFEKARLSNSEFTKEVLRELEEQIKLCEHYLKTKKRKDLFKWILEEKHKPNDWNTERDIWSFSNGKVKGFIEIFKNPSSTKIVYKIVSDCDLYLFYHKTENYKNLRSEKSIKNYIQEIKEYLEEELKKVEYDRRERNFYDFVLNQ